MMLSMRKTLFNAWLNFSLLALNNDMFKNLCSNRQQNPALSSNFALRVSKNHSYIYFHRSIVCLLKKTILKIIKKYRSKIWSLRNTRINVLGIGDCVIEIDTLSANAIKSCTWDQQPETKSLTELTTERREINRIEWLWNSKIWRWNYY